MKLSVIIPTLNEASHIGGVIASAHEEDPAAEIVVVDGGSDDGTAAIAAAMGARVLSSPRGRGTQLRAGAAAAKGDILLFLHADTRLGRGAFAALKRACERPGVTGGNFRVLFDGGDRFSAWLNGFYAWFRRRGLYYGDSAMFVRRHVYDRLGGMRALAVMEDFDFNRRLERLGGTLCIDSPPVTTSSRRFHGRHPIAIVAGWLWIHLFYFLRLPSERLASLYDSERSRQR